MVSVLVLSIARAVGGWLFFPSNKLGAHCVDARGVFRQPAAAAKWKTLERRAVDIPIDASGIVDREAMVRGMPVQDDLSMDVVEEGGRSVRRKFVVAEPDLKTLVGYGVKHGS